jgi:hypothetical protein
VTDTVALRDGVRRLFRLRFVRLAAAAGAVVVATGAWQLFLHDTAEPATVQRAVQRFRQDPMKATETERAGLAPGVYVYATVGSEKVDALGGAQHDYPARTTITVARGGCGWKLRWDGLKSRSTTWERCSTARGDVVRSTRETHRFFGTTQHTDYACGATLERPSGDVPGTTWPFRCTTAGATQKGAGRVVGRGLLAVGGSRVAVVHVRWETTLAGKTTGTSEQDEWLDRATGLPVRLVLASRTSTGSLVGDVHYEERVDLRLTSLLPRR